MEEITIPEHFSEEKPANSLTVVSTVYFRNRVDGGDPQSLITRWSRTLITEEQPYVRSMTVGSEWEPLDTGWLKNEVGLLIILNREGSFPQRIPTPRERSDASKKVVSVGLYNDWGDQISIVPFTFVFPQEDVRFVPVECSSIRLYSEFGTSKISIHAYPR